MSSATIGMNNGNAPSGTTPAGTGRTIEGSVVGAGVLPLPGLVGVGPALVGSGFGVTHGMMIEGSGVGGPPPGSQIGGWAEHTSVGANLPPQVRPKGTRDPSKK
jgi:hypothetical protein